MPYLLKFLFVLFSLCFLAGFKSAAQLNSADTTKPLKIAVLVPIYIDSAFTSSSYQLGENKMPQYILSGLDFYNGVMLAVEALQREGVVIEVSIYDTKSAREDFNTMLGNMKPWKFSLIIASLTNSTEQKSLSEFSFENNIPVISSTYPNDANLSENPFFVMLNPTLKTHVQGIYKLLQKSYKAAKPVFVTRNGAVEEKIYSYFKETGNGAEKYRVKELDDSFSAESLLTLLDSTRQNVIVCGTLNESFAVQLVQTLSANKSYRTTVIGMPTWDRKKQLLILPLNIERNYTLVRVTWFLKGTNQCITSHTFY
jgi:hypothetical protein